jgi:hypothetical protein
MKKAALLLLFVLFGSVAAQVNPQLLQKVIVFPGWGADEQHWNFNEAGLLTDIRNQQGDIIRDFTYDAQNNLILAHNYDPFSLVPSLLEFTYDSENHITSVNGIAYTYEPDANSYYKGNPEDYFRYYLNSEGVLDHEIHHYYDSSNDIYIDKNGVSYNYFSQDHNLGSSLEPQSGSINGWIHNNATAPGANPLKYAMLSIMKAVPLGTFGSNGAKWLDGSFYSELLVLKENHQGDPEASAFVHEINTLNLPVQTTLRNYFYNEPDGQPIVLKLYYYQGDVIP